MSIEAIKWALSDAPEVPASLVATLLGLANHAGPDGRNAYPKIPTIARYTRKSERSALWDIEHLLKLGLIRKGDDRMVDHLPAGQRPSVYDLAIERRRDPKAPEKAAPRPARPKSKKAPTPVVHDRSTPVVDDGRPLSWTTLPLIRNEPSVEPSLEPSVEPPPPTPSAVPPAAAVAAVRHDGGGGRNPAVEAVVDSVAEALGTPAAALHATARRPVAAALDAGWPAPALAAHLAADLPDDVRRPAALTARRLATLPAGPGACDCPGCAHWRWVADAAAAAERGAALAAERAEAVAAERERLAAAADRHDAITAVLGPALTGRLVAARLDPKVRPMPGVSRGVLAEVYAEHGHDLIAIRAAAAALAIRESA